MKHLLIIAFLGCLHLVAFTQPDSNSINPNEPFIYLFNGTLIPANEIIYQEKLLGKNYLSVDDKRYETKEIKFYNSLDGFYANSSKFFVGDFLKRKQKGNANIYIFLSSSSHMTGTGGGYSYSRMETRSTASVFYNIGFDDLKKVKYSNLKLDLSDNSGAMVHLNKYKRTRNIKRGLFFGGAAMMLSAVLAADASVDVLSAGLGTVGATSLLTGVFWGMNRDKHLYKALEAYNGNSFTF